jgi:hypothetical protein
MLNPLSRSKSAPNTVNFEGGRAFTQTAKLELVSVLLTTFLEDEFYRTEKQTTEKIRELITKVGDPRFVAKAALYARNTYGMRSVSHLVAGELAKSVKGALDEKLLRSGRAPPGRRHGDARLLPRGLRSSLAELPEEGSRRGAGSVRRAPSREVSPRARRLQDGGRGQPRSPDGHAGALQAGPW